MKTVKTRIDKLESELEASREEVWLCYTTWNDVPEKSKEEIMAQYERSYGVSLEGKNVLWTHLHHYDHRKIDEMMRGKFPVHQALPSPGSNGHK